MQSTSALSKSLDSKDHQRKPAFNTRNPPVFGVTHLNRRRTFRPQTTTKPDFDANEAKKYFRSVYTDPRREFQYEPYEHLGKPPSADFVASTCPPSFAEFSAVIRSRRNSSAPGPNGIPYTVWKQCPNLQMRLSSWWSPTALL